MISVFLKVFILSKFLNYGMQKEKRLYLLRVAFLHIYKLMQIQ
jgi:hypothetical protein